MNSEKLATKIEVLYNAIGNSYDTATVQKWFNEYTEIVTEYDRLFEQQFNQDMYLTREKIGEENEEATRKILDDLRLLFHLVTKKSLLHKRFKV